MKAQYLLTSAGSLLIPGVDTEESAQDGSPDVLWQYSEETQQYLPASPTAVPEESAQDSSPDTQQNPYPPVVFEITFVCPQTGSENSDSPPYATPEEAPLEVSPSATPEPVIKAEEPPVSPSPSPQVEFDTVPTIPPEYSEITGNILSGSMTANGVSGFQGSGISGSFSFFPLLITTLLILLFVSLIVSMLRKSFRERAANCVILAEEEFAGKRKQGRMKRTYAVNAFLRSVPAILRPFCGVRLAERMIASSFTEMDRFAELHPDGTVSRRRELLYGEEPVMASKTAEEAFREVFHPGKQESPEPPEPFPPSTESEPVRTEAGEQAQGEKSQNAPVVNIYMDRSASIRIDNDGINTTHESSGKNPQEPLPEDEQPQDKDPPADSVCEHAGRDGELCLTCALNPAVIQNRRNEHGQ